MIIACYSGIGKTTMAGRIAPSTNARCIDFDSSLFWLEPEYTDERFDTKLNGWERIYARQALELDKQGLIVMISINAAVIGELSRIGGDPILVYPSLGLKREWYQKLVDRYLAGRSKQNYRAYMNCDMHFDEQIKWLGNLDLIKIPITNMEYNFADIIRFVMEKAAEGKLERYRVTNNGV